MNRRRSILIASLLALAAPLHVVAQDEWPSKVVKFVVPYGAGGSTDALARLVAQRLSDRWGKSVIVENKPGANGIIGTDGVAKSPPDGYTFLVASNGQAVNVALRSNLPYDMLRDFVSVVNIAAMPNVLAIHKAQPAQTLKDLVAQAKTKPGSLAFGHAGVGSSQHLTGEILKLEAKIDIRQVPYKGGGPAVADALGGHVPLVVAGVPAMSQHVKSGALRALAVTGPKRSPQLPDVPTMQEQGYRNDEVFWVALMAPKGTPPAVVARLNAEVNAVLADPAVKAKFAEQGAEVSGGTPEQFDAFLKREIENAARVIKAANIKADG
ncbi:MAG TPA: tripartite tricarboxylate transporter substrate binding protein [Usitatibacter sp.]|nr:tripartite tricarboxylate transporter substrate binding protein [Usitatibacter sp.]